MKDDDTYDLPIDVGFSTIPAFIVISGEEIDPTDTNEIASLLSQAELQARYHDAAKCSSHLEGTLLWALEVLNQFKCR